MATLRITFTLDDQVPAEAAFIAIYQSKGPRRTDFLRRVVSECGEVRAQLGLPTKRKERTKAVRTAGIVGALLGALVVGSGDAAEMRVNRGSRPAEVTGAGAPPPATVETAPLAAPAAGAVAAPMAPMEPPSRLAPISAPTAIAAPTPIAPPPAVPGMGPASGSAAVPMARPAPVPAAMSAEPAPNSVLRDEGGQVYEAHPGEWLSDVLARWSKDSGWQKPEWRSPWGYQVRYSATYRGQFRDVVVQLLRPYTFSGNPPLEFRFAEANRVLIVMTPPDDFGWSRY